MRDERGEADDGEDHAGTAWEGKREADACFNVVVAVLYFAGRYRD